MKSGDFQMMTAGSGIVHTETIDQASRMRLLQLWLNLPKNNRWATPRVQDLQSAHVPALVEDGVSLKLYSGSLSELISPVKNYTPLIVADISIAPNTTTSQQIPANYNTFLYIIRGSVKIGEEKKPLKQGQVGWLDLFNNTDQSDLILTTGDEAVRFVLYAGKPTGDNIVSYGPFVADTNEDIHRLYQEYRQGKMKHISTVPKSQRLLW
jgi:redox-sensitive bicupin YhaK (pirin superfamily)